MVQIEKRQETRGKKKKNCKTNMEARAKSTMEKYGDFKQEIPRKQITS